MASLLASSQPQLLQGYLELNPDQYLHELKDLLKHIHGISVSESSISLALRNRGHSQEGMHTEILITLMEVRLS